MEQITREEIIGLLVDLGEYLDFICDDEQAVAPLLSRIEPAIAALQAAEPVITVDIRRDPRDGSPAPRILKFADLGDGEHQLFALPFPTAKAQVPEGHAAIPLDPENGKPLITNEMKAIHIGEHTFTVPDADEDGNEIDREITVPWSLCKKIYKAMAETAMLTASPAPACQCRTESDEKFGTLIHQCEACESNQVTGRRRQQEEAER